MPFDLRNATQTFQRYIDSLFRHLDFIFCYVHDIIIMSDPHEEHLRHLRIGLTAHQSQQMRTRTSWSHVPEIPHPEKVTDPTEPV